ncbi:hypothetical protein HQ40_05050 [Porphyromonas gulae]|uniref:DUF2334 domain-containing protein n=1 Tax=Porphyromonas gulae TaxID=111105 RepID=UPI00052C4795|nr:DUF2334 domain-containing protein [Porphyromonas gulae]KGN76152.1 hypothetical protein HQ40_05050 [Porphyromonas gulae]
MAIKYLVRLDDACPTMNKKKWQQVENILDKYSIRPMVGVIPNNLDPMQMEDSYDSDFWTKVKKWETKNWAIAMHGNTHLYRMLDKPCGINPVNPFSEYVGKTLEDQNINISEAWLSFVSKGFKPKYFFAPGHTFDQNTLEALKIHTEIRVISDTIAFAPYKDGEFIFIPQQVGYFRKILIPGYWTFCFHPNVMHEKDFKDFELFISENRNRFIKFQDLDLNKASKLSLSDRLLRKSYFFLRKTKKTLQHSI